MFLKCSRCGSQLDAEVGVCAECGLVLGLADVDNSTESNEFPELESEISDLSDAFAAPESLRGADPDDQEQVAAKVEHALTITGVFSNEHVMGQVTPVQNPEFEIRSIQCTPFEGYLFSIIDGFTTIDDVVALSGLTFVETLTALASLHDKGAITFSKPQTGAQEEQAAGDARSEPGGYQPKSDTARLGKLSLRQATAEREPLAVADSDPDVLMELADAALKCGDFARARELARLAVVHAPNSERATVLITALNDPAHAYRRARVLISHGVEAYKQGDMVGAVVMLSAAIEEHEPIASAHHRLAVAMVKLGTDLELAFQHCRRAVDLAPDKEVYARNLQRILDRLQPTK